MNSNKENESLLNQNQGPMVLNFSPVKGVKANITNNQIDCADKGATLICARFQESLHIDFKSRPIGSCTRKLLTLSNPSKKSILLTVSNSKLGKYGIFLDFNGLFVTEVNIPSESQVQGYVVWQPSNDFTMRETIVLRIDDKVPLNLIVSGIAGTGKEIQDSPKREKSRRSSISSKGSFDGNFSVCSGNSIKTTDYRKSIIKGSKLNSSSSVASKVSLSTSKSLSEENWSQKQEATCMEWMNFQFRSALEQNSYSKNLEDLSELDSDGNSVDSGLSELLEKRKEEKLLHEAKRLFQEEQLRLMINAIEKEVDDGRISLRTDRDLLYDVGLQDEVFELISGYEVAWLKIALQVVFLVPLQLSMKQKSLPFNAQQQKLYAQTLRSYLQQHLYNCEEVEALFKKQKVLTKAQEKKKNEALHKHLLHKIFSLIIFLDYARTKKLLVLGALFQRKSLYKSTKDVLIAFCRIGLRGEGDIVKHLASIGIQPQFAQKYIDEFDYFVSNFDEDLKDGLRLSRLLEILLKSDSLPLSSSLRAPAVSRLQKIFNVNKVLEVFYSLGKFNTSNKIESKSIVDGKKDITLMLIWQIMYSFELPSITNVQSIRNEIECIRKDRVWRQSIYAGSNHDFDAFAVSVRTSKQLSVAPEKIESSTIDVNEIEHALLIWVKSIVEQYEVPVLNLSSSLSDGRALCLVIHYYHPRLLQTKQIKKTANNLQTDYSSEDLQQAIANEKNNFLLVKKCLKEIGGIPVQMLGNNISSRQNVDEKTMVVFLTYLFNRLVETSAQVRAAIIIQRTTRQYLTSITRQPRKLHQETVTELKKALPATTVYLSKKQSALVITRFLEKRIAIRKSYRSKIQEENANAIESSISLIIHDVIEDIFTQIISSITKYHDIQNEDVVVCEENHDTEIEAHSTVDEVMEETVDEIEDVEEVDADFEQRMADIDNLDYSFIEENLVVECDEQTIELLDNFRASRRRKSSEKKKARISFGLEQRYEQLLHIMQEDKANLQAQLEMQKVMHSLHLLQLNETDEKQRHSMIRVYEERLEAVHKLMKEQEEQLQSKLQEEAMRRRELELKLEELEAEKTLKLKEEKLQQERKELLQKSSMIISAFVYSRAMKCKYQQMKHAVVKVQTWFRCKSQRKMFKILRLSIVILQACFIRKLIMKKLQVMDEASKTIAFFMRAFLARINFIAFRQAAIMIQRQFRCYLAVKSRIHLLKCVKIIQRSYKRFIHEKRFNKKVTKVQATVRKILAIKYKNALISARTTMCRALWNYITRRKNSDHLCRRRNAIKVIAKALIAFAHWKKREKAVYRVQKFLRSKMLFMRVRRLIRGFGRLAAVVRARKVRHQMFAKCEKLRIHYQRIKEANLNALRDPSLKLGRKTTIALMTLQTGKMISHLLKACHTLFLSTQLSRRCCEAFAAAGASQILFNLLRSCNRSTPHQELLRMALVVLLNVARHPHLAELMVVTSSSNVTAANLKKNDSNMQLSVEAAETLIDLMQMFRDKKNIFLLAVELLARLVFASPAVKSLCNTALFKKRLDGILHIMLRKERLNTKIKQAVTSVGKTSNIANTGSNCDVIKGTNSTHSIVSTKSSDNESQDLFIKYRGKSYDLLEPLSCMEHLFQLLKSEH